MFSKYFSSSQLLTRKSFWKLKSFCTFEKKHKKNKINRYHFKTKQQQNWQTDREKRKNQFGKKKKIYVWMVHFKFDNWLKLNKNQNENKNERRREGKRKWFFQRKIVKWIGKSITSWSIAVYIISMTVQPLTILRPFILFFSFLLFVYHPTHVSYAD